MKNKQTSNKKHHLNKSEAISSSSRATLKFMLSHPAHIISMGLGSGLSPIMPGTTGTLLGWAIFALLMPLIDAKTWLIISIVGFFIGIKLTGFTAKKLRQDDPKSAVIDEIIGFWLVLATIMIWIPFQGFKGFIFQLVAFMLFRLFDIVKPFPISYFDKNFKNGFGIMFDDIVAAIFAIVSFFVLMRLTLIAFPSFI